MQEGGGASRGVGGEGHGEVAASEDELEEVVSPMGGACEDVVLYELHDVHVGGCVGEVAATELRALQCTH